MGKTGDLRRAKERAKQRAQSEQRRAAGGTASAPPKPKLEPKAAAEPAAKQRPARRCRVSYEDWLPTLRSKVLADGSHNAYRRGANELAEVLASLVDRPGEVTLVIPMDFVAAVNLREPGVDFRSNRGSGVVAARTMPRPDGTVDVLVPAAFIGAKDANDEPLYTARGALDGDPALVQLMRRTIVHEAQHAVMAQRGSDWRAYEALGVSPEAAKHHYGAAAKMCDEHRAEYNAIQLTTPKPPTADDVLAVLSHLGQELAAAYSDFQGSNDLRELRDQVYAACIHFWTSVAYWAAQFRQGDEIVDVPADIAQLQAWQRYVGGTWGDMMQALSLLPVTSLTTSPEVLQDAARGLAVAVEKSLNHIGFRHFDGPTSAEFYVDRVDFPDARN
jgi:hypothetical protein